MNALASVTLGYRDSDVDKAVKEQLKKGVTFSLSHPIETKLAKIAQFLIDDIDKSTVEFKSNYDETEKEPSVLPAQFPNLLVNGAGGIAVGMATSIPPHNLGEVINASLALIQNKEIKINELMKHIPGPDFPTGAQIIGIKGIKEASTGSNSIFKLVIC